MRKLTLLAVAVALSWPLMAAVPASAGDAQAKSVKEYMKDTPEGRAQWKKMNPEQRAAKREQLQKKSNAKKRARWDDMSAKEKKSYRKDNPKDYHRMKKKMKNADY